MLDIAATLENRKTRLEWVKNVSSVISIPLTVGGGISTLEDIELVIKAGADKASCFVHGKRVRLRASHTGWFQPDGRICRAVTCGPQVVVESSQG